MPSNGSRNVVMHDPDCVIKAAIFSPGPTNVLHRLRLPMTLAGSSGSSSDVRHERHFAPIPSRTLWARASLR
jgi:hypothetical protein